MAQGHPSFSEADKSASPRKVSAVSDFRRFALPFAASLALLGLAACGSGTETEKAAPSAAPEGKPGISIAEGKLVLPAVAGNPGAAYFALDNESNSTVSIASISIDGVGKTEVHQTMGGQMKPVDQIDVEPKIVIKFEPGALHVMAFEIDDRLKAGDTAELTVVFSDGDKVSAPLKIEAMGTAHGEAH